MDAGAKPDLADKAAEAVVGGDRAATKLDIAELETRVVRELRDQVWRFVGVNAAIAAVVVAAIKLLP